MKEEDILKVEEKIENYIEEHIRPMLMADGGDLEFVHFDPVDGIVYVRFLGHCFTCPFRKMTLQLSIESPLIQNIDEVKEVKLLEADVDLDDFQKSEKSKKKVNK